ncbi:RES family NAD+ phosphorylase [Dyella acidisoli]
MATAWRIAVDTITYKADDRTGACAALTGGRWSAIGTSIIYASPSIALAMLETLVHVSSDTLPLNRYLVRIDIPDMVWSRACTLPCHENQAELTTGQVTAQAGAVWMRSGRSALMRVPSAVIREEFNVLINPAHADAKRINIVKLRRFG